MFLIFLFSTHAGKILLFLFPRICHIHLTNRRYARYQFFLFWRYLKLKLSKILICGWQKINQIKFRYFNVIMFKVSYDNLMRRLVIIQGSNILQIFTHGNTQNVAINIGFSIMHKWSPVSDLAWVTPISLHQMHWSTCTLAMEMYTLHSHLCYTKIQFF